jgi:hypothetical protein
LLTLNQIISQITDLANAHYQIAEVGTGTLAELQSKPDRLYPLLWLSNEGGSLDQNYKIDNIRLTMFGRVIAGEEGQDDDASELEVLSDMQLILLDFLNYFHQQHGQEYVTDKAATLEHFTERTNDRTAGYSCVLELKQFYDWNKCQIPQSGASIPPSVDGLTLYDFCDQATIDRLTSTQIACLEAEFGNCADATVQLNGTTVGTIPSGDSDSFTVNLDGSPSGSWDGTAWQVTSPPCDDATIELNGVEMTTIPSGATDNISVRQSSGATEVGSKQGTHWRIDDSAISINGSPVADVKAEDPLDIDVTQDGSPVGSWDGSAWIVPPCAAPSIAISYSNNTPTYGDTITITATPTGITPTFYTFIIAGNIDETITIQAGNTLSWVVNTLNPTIYVQATDGSSFAASVDGSLTVSSITEAGAFITALETLTSDTMEGRQKDAVNRLVWMLKGNDTTNSTDLWTLLTATNAAWYIYCPNDDATAYFDGYKIDLLDPTHTGTFINMVAGDISVEGVKGGSGKALNMDVQPADFDLDNIMCHFYQSKYGFNQTVPMGVHLTTQNTNGVSAFWQGNATQAIIRVNNAGGGSYPTKQSITGVMSFGRDSATQVKTATNGNYDGTANVASVIAITEDFYGHGYQNASTGVSTFPSPNTYAGFSVTPWLSADEYLDFSQAWDEFNKIIITDGRKCKI